MADLRLTVVKFAVISIAFAFAAPRADAATVFCDTPTACCGVVFSDKTTVVLNTDQLCVAPVAVGISMTIGEIDLNGYTYDCNSIVSDGFSLNGTVKVTNGVVQNCADDGVVLGGGVNGGKHKISDVVSKNNTGDGFQINQATDKSQFKNTLAVGNGAAGYRLGLLGVGKSNKNKLSNAIASRNGAEGFRVYGDGNKFKGCTSTGNTTDGFWVAQDSTLNQLSECTASGNSDGFAFGRTVPGGPHKVSKCVATDNTMSGFEIAMIDGMSMSKCTASDNLAAGIEVVQGSDAAIKKCSIADSMGDGIVATSTTGLQIVGSRVSNSGDDGIEVNAATTGAVNKNVVLGSGDLDMNDLGACANVIWEKNTFNPSASSNPCIQ